MNNQCNRILDYLRKHPNGITQFEALSELGIMRLASRISDLRDQGNKILAERIKVKNRFNEECYVCKYTLVEEVSK